jgi:hypothetical protein
MHLVPLTFRSRNHARFDCEIWFAANRKKDIKQSFGIAPQQAKAIINLRTETPKSKFQPAVSL